MKAKRLSLVLAGMALGTAGGAVAQTNLAQVLEQMNKSASTFQDVKANITVDNYTAVVQEHEMQTGWTAFRRAGGAMEMVTHLKTSEGKPVADLLFSNAQLIYLQLVPQPQETIFSASANGGEANALLATGFGATGKQMESAWTVTFDGMESVDGVQTAKLELVSKNATIRDNFSKVTIWVDLSRDITLKQVSEQPDGDSRTVTYSNIEYNKRLSGSLFALKIPSGTPVTHR